MLEILDHPAFYPALYGFLGGLVFTWFVFSIRLGAVRKAAKASEKATAEKAATASSEKSALETEIATLRSNEARLMKYQGELESRTKSDQKRNEEFSRLLDQLKEELESALNAREKVLLKAIDKIELTAPAPPVITTEPAPTPVEDLDFVPLENLPGAATREEEEEEPDFIGFDVDETTTKAESAANAFREALKRNAP